VLDVAPTTSFFKQPAVLGIRPDWDGGLFSFPPKENGGHEGPPLSSKNP
jgi:hypothetical protein